MKSITSCSLSKGGRDTAGGREGVEGREGRERVEGRSAGRISIMTSQGCAFSHTCNTTPVKSPIRNDRWSTI